MVFVLACHALRVGKNPAALFYAGLVKAQAIRGYVAGMDEDAARQMLARLQPEDSGALAVAAAAYAVAGESRARAGDAAAEEGRGGIPDEAVSGGAKPLREGPALSVVDRCWHDDVHVPGGKPLGWDVSVVEAEGASCRGCGSVMVSGEWVSDLDGGGSAAQETEGGGRNALHIESGRSNRDVRP